jgi:hypothetical protein
MDLRETGWGSVDWIQLAQDRVRWRALMNEVSEGVSQSVSQSVSECVS